MISDKYFIISINEHFSISTIRDSFYSFFSLLQEVEVVCTQIQLFSSLPQQQAHLGKKDWWESQTVKILTNENRTSNCSCSLDTGWQLTYCSLRLLLFGVAFLSSMATKNPWVKVFVLLALRHCINGSWPRSGHSGRRWFSLQKETDSL